MNTIRQLFTRFQTYIGVRGHTLVAKSIAGIEKTVTNLEKGILHIEQDKQQVDVELAANRAKHYEAQRVLYAKQDEYTSAADRARRVSDRFKGLVS